MALVASRPKPALEALRKVREQVVATFDFESYLSPKPFDSKVFEEVFHLMTRQAVKFKINELHVEISTKHFPAVLTWCQGAFKVKGKKEFLTPSGLFLVLETKASSEDLRATHLKEVNTALHKMPPKKQERFAALLGGLGSPAA